MCVKSMVTILPMFWIHQANQIFFCAKVEQTNGVDGFVQLPRDFIIFHAIQQAHGKHQALIRLQTLEQ